MDDKKILDNENLIQGLDEDDIKEFEAGKDEETFDPGMEDAFGAEKDVEFFEVNGEVDEFEDEMEQEYEDEITYSTAGKKKGFFFEIVSITSYFRRMAWGFAGDSDFIVPVFTKIKP